MDQIIIQTLHGLVNGMVLAMVASGLTLIFGIMDIVNFAHGDLLMLGAFVGASVLGVTGNYWLALIGAAAASAPRAPPFKSRRCGPPPGGVPRRPTPRRSRCRS